MRTAEAEAPRRPCPRPTAAPQPLPKQGRHPPRLLTWQVAPRTAKDLNADSACSHGSRQGADCQAATRVAQRGQTPEARDGVQGGSDASRGHATADPASPVHAWKGAGRAPGRLSWESFTINVACTWGCARPFIPPGQEVRGTEGSGQWAGFPTPVSRPPRE